MLFLISSYTSFKILFKMPPPLGSLLQLFQCSRFVLCFYCILHSPLLWHQAEA